ncbi:unnamed protein product [Rhizophagus irregularis]|nr:unnamed protein product [Rhizophagus irregularis]
MDKWIIEKIKSEDINYFDYKEFSDNVEIGRGGFGIVYKANWNKRGMKDAALKSMLNNNNNSPLNKEKFEEFIKELRLIRSLHYNDNINRFRGVTQDLSGNYMMVLQYANEGTLRDYLGNKERDLHSKNILVNDGKLMIADLGLSKQLTVQSNSEANGVIGMTEYIDPCILNGLSSNPDSINNGKTNNNLDETKNSRNSFISSSLIINVINVNWKFIKEKSNKPGEMELNELVNEIVQGYLRKNNNGTTKTFDFEHILRKYESQSTCLFNHLKNNPSKIHYEVVIGIFYKRGFGVEKSEKESFDRFKNASQKGDINSHYELGECFYNGTGTKKDFDKAFEYYKFAADKGLNIALFTLAKYYYNSNEYAKSIDYYEKSANKDFVPSQYYVAKFYNNGYGKKMSIKKGLKWLEKYREKDGSWNITDEIKKLEARKPLDIAEAINEIVEDYKKNNHSGATKNFDFKYTLEKYEPRSKDIFNQLRDNQALIQHYEVVIGTFYKKGFGVDKDEKESFEWFKNDGSWEISDEIAKVEKQLVDQKEGNSLALL